MTSPEVLWVNAERAKVVEYVRRNIDGYAGIGEWPAFHVHPHFAIWAVESAKNRGSVGFWVFSGDIATDCIIRNWQDKRDSPRKALSRMTRTWETYVQYLESGQNPPGISMGDGAVMRKKMAALLKKRLGTLTNWVHDDEMWDADCGLDA